jgi:CubicO group peptidase (beta-lactamase class C family)
MSAYPASVISSLAPFVQSGALAGAVTLVASKDRILSLESIGYADIAAKTPMRTDQMFWIASMTKPIAATLMMMLVEEGKVDLEAPLENYLPEFKGQMVEAERDDKHVLLCPLRQPITVADALRHTSGLPFLSRLEPRIDVLSLRETAFAAAMSNLVCQPGSKYLYSNCGTNAAARIVELIAKMPFEKFLDERLLIPLRMSDTTFWPSDEQVARLAKTYKANEQKTALEETRSGFLTYPLQSRSRYAHPGGGLFSSITDVYRFCRMIASGGVLDGRRYLSATCIRRMTTTQTGTLAVPGSPAGAGYGFGWHTQLSDPGDTDAPLVAKCGHGGALATQFCLYPQQGLITIYLVQHQGYAHPDGDKIFSTFENAALQLFGDSVAS